VKPSSSVPRALRFGVFELDPRAGELRKKGMKIRLQGQPVEILAMLLERPGETITREELKKKLWPADTFVDFEQGLNNAMNRLRAAFDDDAESPPFIETLLLTSVASFSGTAPSISLSTSCWRTSSPARPARRAQVPAGAQNGTTGALSRDRTELELDLHTAIGYFTRAIEKDPDYALAYAGLANAYIALGGNSGGGHYPKETLPEAKAAATKASELDPSLGEAHFSLAQTMKLYDWNWYEAENEYRLALELNPNYADAHLEYGRFLQDLGRNDEATAQMNYAIELDPFNFKTMEVVGYVTYASGQYDLAIEQFSRLGDDFGLGWAYREKKMYPEAIAALERSLSRSGRHELPLASLAGVYGLARGEALELIDELKARARRRYVPGSLFAQAYTGLGEKDEAIAWLERAYEEHDQGMVDIKAYPGLDSLRSDPRFQAVLRRMNFPQ
jgi:tetratricopeptide (TPR) repeat protein